MDKNGKLEAYLTKLDRALAPLPVSDRAEILLEIKSHVTASLEKNPDQPMDTLLSALGEPEMVANRYLLERGKTPVKPPISPIVKWLVIGFLGTLALLLFFVSALVWKFSPILQVDEENDRVRIMGGLIDVDGKTGQVRVGPGKISGSFELDADWGEKFTFEGSQPLEGTGPAQIEVRFGNGKMELQTSEAAAFRWDCRTGKKDFSPKPKVEKNQVILDLGSLKGVRCELSVPKDSELKLSGTNGKLEIDEPRFHLDAKLVNGSVLVAPVDGQPYNFDFSVVNGSMDSFVSADTPSAYRLKVKVTNGKINQEGEAEGL